MEDDFANTQPPKAPANAGESVVSGRPGPPTEVSLHIPGYRGYDDALDAEWRANIRETRILRNIVLISAVFLFVFGVLLIVGVIVFTIVSSISLITVETAGTFLTNIVGAVSGILATIGGGALFKYYQSLQQDLQQMWDKLDRAKRDHLQLENIICLFQALENKKRRDDLIVETVQKLTENLMDK